MFFSFLSRFWKFPSSTLFLQRKMLQALNNNHFVALCYAFYSFDERVWYFALFGSRSSSHSFYEFSLINKPFCWRLFCTEDNPAFVTYIKILWYSRMLFKQTTHAGLVVYWWENYSLISKVSIIQSKNMVTWLYCTINWCFIILFFSNSWFSKSRKVELIYNYWNSYECPKINKWMCETYLHNIPQRAK